MCVHARARASERRHMQFGRTHCFLPVGSRFRCWNLLLNCFTSSQVIYQNFLTTSPLFCYMARQTSKWSSVLCDAAIASATPNTQKQWMRTKKKNEYFSAGESTHFVLHLSHANMRERVRAWEWKRAHGIVRLGWEGGRKWGIDARIHESFENLGQSH